MAERVGRWCADHEELSVPESRAQRHLEGAAGQVYEGAAHGVDGRCHGHRIAHFLGGQVDNIHGSSPG
jgi:hypothetical protein